MDPRDKRQNLANLIKRIENEPGFKDILLQEFLDAKTDDEIKKKYDLSNAAIKEIRREYNWGDLIKTARFSRNWAKELLKKKNLNLNLKFFLRENTRKSSLEKLKMMKSLKLFYFKNF